VISPSGCSWTAASSIPWISILSGAAGSGNGQVSYSVAANSGASTRTGTLAVAGNTFTVTQTGVSCTFSLAPISNSVNSSGGTGTVNVNATSGCTWNGASNVSWITITSGGSGSGSGQVGYMVAPNTSPSSRAGTVTIAGQTFTVNQQAAPCVYSLSEAEQSFSSSEADGVVSVNTASGCPWSASSQSSWITLTSGSSGMGSGAVQYTIEANTGSDLRTGNMTIGGKSFKVTQAGADSAPVIVVEPVLVDFGRVAGGDTGSQPLKISNKGTAPLTIKGMRITSRTLGVFKSEGGCQTLAPGESCTLTLKFEPVSRGIIQGIMKIFSDGSNRRTTQVKLKGAGI
jgi:Abnormal spindle-like microcephaly-assoc'd, ASPM-SPD-2-Hydin/Viral BACON domain/Putative binding domain, N-terminal